MSSNPYEWNQMVKILHKQFLNIRFVFYRVRDSSRANWKDRINIVSEINSELNSSNIRIKKINDIIAKSDIYRPQKSINHLVFSS